MSRTLIPLQLKPHLAAFMFEQFTGGTATYCGQTVKYVNIHTTSALGRYIRMMVTKSGYPPKPKDFNLCLSVLDREQVYDGTFYGFVDGRKQFLMIEPEFVEDLNTLLQNVFETALYYYVEGFKQQKYMGAVRDGIRSFIDKYDLYEKGYSFAALLQVYYRAQRRNTILAKVHSRIK